MRKAAGDASSAVVAVAVVDVTKAFTAHMIYALIAWVAWVAWVAPSVYSVQSGQPRLLTVVGVFKSLKIQLKRPWHDIRVRALFLLVIRRIGGARRRTKIPCVFF